MAEKELIIELAGNCPQCSGIVVWPGPIGSFDPKTMIPPICRGCAKAASEKLIDRRPLRGRPLQQYRLWGTHR